MWKCHYCQEEITKEKYKHCWNCGKPQISLEEFEKASKKFSPVALADIYILPPVEIKPLAEYKPDKVESPSKADTLKIIETPKFVENPIKEEPPKNEETQTNKEVPGKTNFASEGDFLSPFETEPKFKASSIIGKLILVLLWLAAVSAIGYFTYLSYQKTDLFERKIAEDFQNFNNQRSKFVFPPIPVLRRGTVIEGNVRPKILPVNVKTSEIETLFTSLPDDLRPTSLDEVNTLMWFDCENNAVGKYPDGKTGYREKCTVYLVERESSKFIGIQEFLGVMPVLGKESEGQETIGKVFPEKYVAYLREKQPEAERGKFENSSESPNHHFYNKSEFIYGVLLLALLTAVGLGWLAFNLRFDRREG